MAVFRSITGLVSNEKIQVSIAITAVVLLNLITFKGHYLGDYAFPWDFLGGYHAQSFGWFDQGSIFPPPAWLPWSDLGFPSSMALQSGAWYLPLAILDALGIPYTVRVAVSIQCVHVAIAALGVYALCRRVGLGFGVSLLGALAYHSSATFYSNQQHVDIVRAAALVPWVLYFLHPATLSRYWGVPIGAIVLSQLLIAGYPGNIVAAAYACAVWCLFCLPSLPPGSRWRYVLSVACLVTIGLTISMVKWYPVLINLGAVGFERWEPHPIEIPFLETLLFAYDRAFLPSDITMRSLWLPLSLLLGITFLRVREWSARNGIALVLLALFMGMLAPTWDALLRILPGMTASRWLISDWRPILQIGLILMACAGWQAWFNTTWSRLALHIRVSAAFSVLMFAAVMAQRMGYTKWEALPLLAVAAVILLAASWLANKDEIFPRFPSIRIASSFGLLAAVLICAALQGLHYNSTQARPWRMPWSEARETEVYGKTVEDWKRVQPASPMRRPARMLIGDSDTPQAAIDRRTSELYNQCWYGHSYCVFGYNNIRMSMPHKRFVEALQGPSGGALLAFVSEPQQLWIDNGSHDVPPYHRGAAVVGSDFTGISVDFAGYKPDRIDYIVKTPRTVSFTENEIWWKGWEYRYCSSSGCSEWKDTTEGKASLRRWTVPAGEWHVVLRFKDRSIKQGMGLTAAGFIVAALWPVIAWLRRRRNKKVRADR
ncbi:MULTISPECIES: hypothetical protein [Xanthomonas]|uniref:hypothetical protein n=1 Tax=Xanthomonas TaxID=338 RepID=UPI0012902728|nr:MULTISPECIES: hypothetical protein [Xanthomonas]